MRIVFALALKAGIGPIDHPFGQGVGGRPGLKQRVVVLRVDGGWRQRQYTAVFIANEEVFTGVPFFFTQVMHFLGRGFLGAIRRAFAAINKEGLGGRKTLKKCLDVVDLSFG